MYAIWDVTVDRGFMAGELENTDYRCYWDSWSFNHSMKNIIRFLPDPQIKNIFQTNDISEYKMKKIKNKTSENIFLSLRLEFLNKMPSAKKEIHKMQV